MPSPLSKSDAVDGAAQLEILEETVEERVAERRGGVMAVARIPITRQLVKEGTIKEELKNP